jgi:amino acid transporter
MDMQKKQIIGILAIIGALIAIIGVFLPWETVKIVAAGYGETTSASGWDFVTDFDADGIKDVLTKYAPVLCIIGGILTLIIFLLNFVQSVKVNKYIPVISLIVMILALIFCIVAVIDINDNTGSLLGVTVSIGYGLWICLIGVILAIISPIIALIKREDPVAAYTGAISDATGKE